MQGWQENLEAASQERDWGGGKQACLVRQQSSHTGDAAAVSSTIEGEGLGGRTCRGKAYPTWVCSNLFYSNMMPCKSTAPVVALEKSHAWPSTR